MRDQLEQVLQRGIAFLMWSRSRATWSKSDHSSSLAGAASRSSRCTSVPTDVRNRAGIRNHNDIFKPAVLRHLHADGSSAQLYVGMASVLRPLTNA